MKNLMVFSLMMFVSVFAFAQKGQGNNETRIEKKVERMTEQLNLSADQQVKVKALLTEQDASRKMMGKKGEKGKQMTEEERNAMKTEHKAAKAKFDAEMAAILTAEQQESYKGMSKGKGKSKGKKGAGKNKAPKKSSADRIKSKVAKMTTELNLNAEQQAQITELMTNKAEAQKANNGKVKKDMTEDEKAAYKADRKAQKEAYNAELANILTEEQMTIYLQKKDDKKKMKEDGKKGKSKGKAHQKGKADRVIEG